MQLFANNSKCFSLSSFWIIGIAGIVAMQLPNVRILANVTLEDIIVAIQLPNIVGN